MATVLKCKMCGGDIEVSQDMTVGKCLFCGSLMTLPKIDSEKKARLFNRANEYRLNNEFDKAYDAYKSISEEDEQESEAYWGMLLSEYGVEYVEDPKTNKRIPTCHRTKLQSIQSTTNYSLACKYADADSRFIFQDEAEEIDRLQKKILSISSKEEPYDVFICYKETDPNTNERTQDSVVAQEIYNELTKGGLKVFFSRITLEDKLGQDYEPYIFSALNSARVMLVVTSSNENVNSVWVKNEWSRFLRFSQDDPNKVVIPIYKGMEIYELPDELSRYQAQNYDKVGALQDICHSVTKLVSIEERQHKDSLIDELIQDKIKQDQKKNARIAQGRKAASIVKKIAIVVAATTVLIGLFIAGKVLYQNVLKPNNIYKNALSSLKNGDYEKAITLFSQIADYKDSNLQISECNYLLADQLREKGSYVEAENIYTNLGGYKDSIEALMRCRYERGVSLYNDGEYEDAIIVFRTVKYDPYQDMALEGICDCIYEMQMASDTKLLVFDNYKEYMNEEMLYNIGTHMMDEGEYYAALSAFEGCILYNDSSELWKETKYILGKNVYERTGRIEELYDAAMGVELHEIAPNFSADELIYKPALDDFNIYAEAYYNEGLREYNSSKWTSASEIFEQFNNAPYKDAKELKEYCYSRIEEEKASYEGIWRGTTARYCHLKIENGKLYYSEDSWNDTYMHWRTPSFCSFDGDTGHYIFSNFSDEKYEASINGNTIVIKCIYTFMNGTNGYWGNTYRLTRM